MIMWRLQIAQIFETARKKNYACLIRTSKVHSVLQTFFFFFFSLVQCHCGLNLLGVHHLTFSEPQARIFYPHKRKSDFFLVLVEDCRVRLLFILCIFQTKIFLYYKIWRRKNKININMYILLKLLFPYWCFIYRYFQQFSALSRLPVTANWLM